VAAWAANIKTTPYKVSLSSEQRPWRMGSERPSSQRRALLVALPFIAPHDATVRADNRREVRVAHSDPF
jgi:hypothetical protein